MDHLRANGFRVKPIAVEDAGMMRRRHGIPDTLAGCHTAVVDGYAIEGHVPAREIKRLLAEKPRARGLAVPGMPPASPGMDVPGRRDPYDVLIVHDNGRHSIYSSYRN